MVYLFLFTIIFILLIVLSFVWPPESPWSPWWRTGKKTAEAVAELAGISKKDTVFELGSGDGGALVTIAQKTRATCVGIEIEHTRFCISLIRKAVTRTKNVSFIREDFKKVDMHKASVIYMYLVPAGMKRTMPIFKKNLRSGTKLVSYVYKIPLEKGDTFMRLKKEDKVHGLYLYEVS